MYENQIAQALAANVLDGHGGGSIVEVMQVDAAVTGNRFLVYVPLPWADPQQATYEVTVRRVS